MKIKSLIAYLSLLLLFAQYAAAVAALLAAGSQKSLLENKYVGQET